MIVSHGTLEAMVRAEAERWGWRATVRDQDIDVVATASKGRPVRDPGAGTIVLERDGDRTVLEYGLPEDEDELRRAVHAALRGDEIQQARLRDRHAADAIVVGG